MSPAATDSRRVSTGRRALAGIGAELMQMRAVFSLVAVCLVFQSQTSSFLSAFNLTNLLLQVAAVGVISIGVVFVLLAGEIDLSVGVVSAFTAACMASLITERGVDPLLAMGAAVVTGAGIGLVHGVLVTWLTLPSFIVTLAGLLVWQGALVWVLGISGSITVSAPEIVDLTHDFLSPGTGWVVAVVLLVLALTPLVHSPVATERTPVLRRVLLAAVVVAVTVALVATLNQDRGVPVALVLLLCATIAFQHVAARTTYGRHLYAVGGNAEAARRAGIRVDAVRVSVFAVAGALSACGGILAASRLLSVGTTSGGSDLLLLAIAGPIIAGTSLFGGRGSVWSALLGALVIGAISNGMDLLNFEPYAKSIITGIVLLAAITLDVVSRRYGGQR